MNIASSWRTPAFDDSLELSTKILEYSALGIPVLMNPSPIHLRVFGRDYPGYVTTHGEFVERVLSLASSPHLYEGASRGVHSIASSFTYASHRQRLLPLLRSARPRVESKDRTRTILWAGHDFKFLRSIRELVEREGPYRGLTDQLDGHVVRNPQRSQELLREADVIFCEWCLGNAEWYSQHKLAGQLLVVRLHRQEIDLPYLQRIEWDNVDRLVFINGWVMDRFLLQFPSMRPRTVLIHNAIDCRALGLDKLFGAEFNLGLLGYCPKLKAPHLALDILAQLKELDRRYTLFIKGRSPRDYDWLWKRPEERNYYEDLDARLEQFPHANSVVFEPHSDDVPAWLSKIGFILSTSDIEGSHQAVAEGMASGAIPVIRNWAGAEELYPSKYVFSKTHEAAHLVDLWHSSEHYSAEVLACRELAHAFDLSVIVREYLDLLAALVADPTACTHGITQAIPKHREAAPRRQPVPVTM